MQFIAASNIHQQENDQKNDLTLINKEKTTISISREYLFPFFSLKIIVKMLAF